VHFIFSAPGSENPSYATENNTDQQFTTEVIKLMQWRCGILASSLSSTRERTFSNCCQTLGKHINTFILLIYLLLWNLSTCTYCSDLSRSLLTAALRHMTFYGWIIRDTYLRTYVLKML